MLFFFYVSKPEFFLKKIIIMVRGGREEIDNLFWPFVHLNVAAVLKRSVKTDLKIFLEAFMARSGGTWGSWDEVGIPAVIHLMGANAAIIYLFISLFVYLFIYLAPQQQNGKKMGLWFCYLWMGSTERKGFEIREFGNHGFHWTRVPNPSSPMQQDMFSCHIWEAFWVLRRSLDATSEHIK